ncbi:phosphotransferase [Iamia sp. SCSIO 61187]|uniref:phosphotransferase n=1 Tax=Iamia sp. SCSIO 61187 TaxID=2722752 RepID=UPI001C62EEB8|nr:phosphotransferase [Iamia sp. SCSIO 61187]QYG91431.1 phosphotransferase [Iamia sp. SCSIO 61187]
MSDANQGLDVAVAAADAGLTPERLTDVLRAEGHDVTVAELGVEPVGTGQMGSSFRLTPSYEGDATRLPETFVAKVPGGDPASRATAAGAYRTEVAFYQRLAATVAVRVPLCHHAWATDDGTDFLLLLEDLAPARQGDQIAGCTPAQAVAAARNLAGLHGPRWCDATLPATTGLAVVDPASAEVLGDVLGPMTDVFADRMGDRLPAATRAVLDQVPPVAGAWLTGRAERFAPVHGDYRLDNLMFGPADQVTAVDWQTVSLGLPARDIAFLLATSLTVADRRAHEGEVVSAYWDALHAYGVDDHPLEQCLEDYRYALLQAPLIIVLGCAVAAPTARGDEMFLVMAERACAAIRDHDPFSLIDI